MAFRLIMQPAMALFCAVRVGLRDAREGRPPFLWTVLWDPSRRRELLREARNDVGSIFLLALVMDSIYQVIVYSTIYAVQLFLIATILALVPYVIVRGLVTRLARRLLAVRRADGRPGNEATLGENPRKERLEG
jgi:hypothetical protein